ncbi:MAG: DUF748 domain-containing protein [Candidatus Omnitrophica bacterium]|nr:DUF748 domain-containing protein [Candidatus Omnitrophota bacterium]
MKKFIIAFSILLLIISGVTVYLNKVLLPKKIKALIISTLTEQTGKHVTLKSLEFSIFRGLVLRDLVISDGEKVILSTRQATCTVFIWPIFKKQIIIPSVNFKAPYIFIQRRADNSFNLQDFFVLTKPAAKKSDFSVAVFKLVISSGNIAFQDDAVAGGFKKELRNIQLNLHLGLPVKLKFNLAAELAGQPAAFINASGEYKILNRELTGEFNLKNLSIQELGAYSNLGDMISGLVNLQGQVNLKNQLLQVNLSAGGQGFIFTKEDLKAKLDSTLQSKINYNLDTKKLEFNGICDIQKADIAGLEFLGQVKNLNGKFVFDQRSLVADSLKAELMGLPFKVNLGIKDFSTRVLNISTDFDLSILPAVAKEKFNFSGITSSGGSAVLSVKLHPDNQGSWVVQGDLGVTGATLKLDKIEGLFEDIRATLEFSKQGLSWKDTKFRYKGISYQTGGTLSNFTAPQIKARFSSDDLSLTGDLNLSGKRIKIVQLKGKYLDSQFLVSGDIDQSDPAKLQAALTGSVNLELSNLNKLLEKIYPAVKTISPAGQLDTQFSLSGPIADFKNCYLQVKSTSSNLSLYGLKVTDLSLGILLEQAIAKITAVDITFYDGVIQGSGALNLSTKDLAYQLELKASGIDLGKLKLDTPSKNKNISGTFVGEVKLNGAGSNLDSLDAAGSFAVSHGRLGELNLLQGLGKLLLAKDLASIEFTGCSCDFLLKNKFIYTDRFKIHSNIVNLTGPVKIGFDNSLEGALDVEILSEMIPLDGTFKDVTTAIIGKGGKFGVIKLSGSLSEPKYSFKTAVGSIIQGLTNMIFKK